MSTDRFWLDAIVAFLILTGGAFALIGSIGLARLPDFFTRLHGPSKATTLGVGGMVVAAALYFSTTGQGLSLHEFLITIFISITTPISAHLLSKAALHRRLPGSERFHQRDVTLPSNPDVTNRES
jgi:multicomponent K+:H+ antiporter subunit G